jgi:hypothetical protein
MASPDLHPDVAKHLYTSDPEISQAGVSIETLYNIMNPSNDHFKETSKQSFIDDIQNTFSDGSVDLTPEEMFDCLKSSISSALDYAKTEYDKYRYIADQLGIE